MGKVYNRRRETPIRQELRSNSTPAEKALWQILRRRQLNNYRFQRQYSIGRYVVDFYCADYRLAVEIDGPSHSGKEAKEFDAIRQQNIEAHGIKVLRFTNYQVLHEIQKVLKEIASYLDSLVSPP